MLLRGNAVRSLHDHERDRPPLRPCRGPLARPHRHLPVAAPVLP
ncbi:hypothetical protein ACFPRL_13300 [Pseudoclavibacter helvolus]